MEGSLAVFWHGIIAMCVLVQPKDKFLGDVNKDACDSIVGGSKSRTADSWKASKLAT